MEAALRSPQRARGVSLRVCHAGPLHVQRTRERGHTMSGSLPDVAATLDRLVYPDRGLVLCQDGERAYEREANITYLPLLRMPWVCRRRARQTDGSFASSTHASRLEALRTLVAEGYHTLVGLIE